MKAFVRKTEKEESCPDLTRCEQKRDALPMKFLRMTEHRRSETFTGIVQSIDYLRHNPPDVCWRVTMRDVLLEDDIATEPLRPDQLKAENNG